MIGKLLSICIPCYEMSGKGKTFLLELFESIEKQSYRNIEIVIADHSKNNVIEDFIASFKMETDIYIKYVRNTKNYGSMGGNLNCSVENANGEYIKIMCQDDIFYDKDAIKKIVEVLSGDVYWVCGGCGHFKYDVNEPYFFHDAVWTDDVVNGNNKLGAPSVIAFKKTDVKFDVNLSWLVDCLFYHEMNLKYGKPVCIDETLVLIREWNGSTTNTLATKEFRQKENEYVKNKIEKG